MMEHTLPLSSIIALFVPMPLLILFSIASLIRQSKKLKSDEETASPSLYTAVEKRNV